MKKKMVPGFRPGVAGKRNTQVKLTGFALVLLGIYALLPPDLQVQDAVAGFFLQPPMDSRFRHLAIDDNSFLDLERRWPWPRSVLAQGVEKLAQAGVKVLVVDILLSDPGFTPEEDQILAKALRFAKDKGMKVILAGRIGRIETGDYSMESFFRPLDEFLEASAFVGLSNMAEDSDGILRRLPLEISHLERKYPSLALAAARALGKDISQRWGDQETVLMGFSGGNIPTQSYTQFLEDQNLGFYRGTVVFLGAHYPESQDISPTPLAPEGRYRVDYWAQGVNAILQGAFYQSATWILVGTVILGLFGLFIFAGKSIHSPWLLVFLAVMITLLGPLGLFSTTRTYLTPIAPGLGTFGALIWVFLTRYWAKEKERARIRKMFSSLVGPQVMESLLGQSQDLALGGGLRRVTIFFSDIRNFTGMSEKLPAPRIVSILNTYFQVMEEIIDKYQGNLNKFIGDAIMVIYNAPMNQGDSSERAVKAALEMRERLKTLVFPGEDPEFRLMIGMAIHTGEVVVGQVGSMRRMEYTVIGDPVNLCSRMEGLTKDFSTDLLISDEVLKDLPPDYITEDMGLVAVKGKAQEIRVHKVGVRQ